MFCISCTSSSGKMEVAKIHNENNMNNPEDFLPIDPHEEKKDEKEPAAKVKSYKKFRNSVLMEEDTNCQDLSTLLPAARETDLDQNQTDVKRLCSNQDDQTDSTKKKSQKQPEAVHYAKNDKKAKNASSVERKKYSGKSNSVTELEKEDDQDGRVEFKYRSVKDECGKLIPGHVEGYPSDSSDAEVNRRPSGRESKRKKSKKRSKRSSPSNYSRDDLDYNVYAAKKNISQGLVDIALLTANATQLKYLLSIGPPPTPSKDPWQLFQSLLSSSSYPHHNSLLSAFTNRTNASLISEFEVSTGRDHDSPWTWYFYWANFTSIGVSILLQIIVGILLLMNSRHDVSLHRDKSRAECCNSWILFTVFLITLINIFIGVFINYDVPG